ncbi:hypothetical protein JCGZ_13050 [Jatropha curcas]|uniref:Uncharacterized protein n=1 Tax=Jatropha curcas TaxID=180498 RepID=A0A067KMI3_JATCU|nr:uncharacterized protein LOC105638777 [Jatropha curcas]KDP33019.1 hypothetical protein JCGZ_13050 [Jatropha curcas]
MDIISAPFTGTWRRYWRRKRYQRLDGGIRGRKNMKVIRIGDRGSPKRGWKIRTVAKIRILKIVTSPLKLIGKLKSAYVNMMLNLAGNVGLLNNDSVFGNKRIPKARQVPTSAYSNEEFEARLVYEIYKALKATQ